MLKSVTQEKSDDKSAIGVGRLRSGPRMKCRRLDFLVLVLLAAGTALFSKTASADEACPEGSNYVSAMVPEMRVIYDGDTKEEIWLRNIGRRTVFVQLNREVPLQNDLQPRQLGIYETNYLLARGEKKWIDQR